MWDNVFNVDKYVYGKEPNLFLEQNYQKLPKNGKILSLAEGEGRNAVFLAKRGFLVTAVDSSKVGLEKAEKLAKDNNVEIETIHADLSDFDLGFEKWDGIISIFCQLPSIIRKKLYENLSTSLTQNGIFLLEGYRVEQLTSSGVGGPPDEDMMLSVEILKNETSNLDFEYLQNVEREIVEGTQHYGIGALVQAIGKKK